MIAEFDTEVSKNGVTAASSAWALFPFRRQSHLRASLYIMESLAGQGCAGECERDSKFPASPAVFFLPAQGSIVGGLALACQADAGIRVFFITGFTEFRAWRVSPSKAVHAGGCGCFLFIDLLLILSIPQVSARCWVLLQQRAQQPLGKKH